MVRSEHWQAMADAGVRLAVALPIGFPLSRPLKGRIDMRNHRKIVVIDNRITYCGSNNCADAAFAIKPRFAPWVDAMMRFEGPIVRQNQHVFATDWMGHVKEDLSPLFDEPLEIGEGFPAQVIATGATVRYSAMPEMFESLMYAARRELVITTPYYVPDEPIQAALCASARRGVDTTIVFPARNDSWIVAAASHSYYPQLLDAGVKIYEYVGGLLHTKSMTVDGEITLIGSANIDRRSFELNFENNILLVDRDADRRHARAAGELHRPLRAGRRRRRHALVAPPAHLEQHHRDARPRALRPPRRLRLGLGGSARSRSITRSAVRAQRAPSKGKISENCGASSRSSSAPEQAAGAVQPRLHRLRQQAEQRRRLRGAHPLDLAQHEDGAERRRQAVDRAFEHGAHAGAAGLALGAGRVRGEREHDGVSFVQPIDVGGGAAAAQPARAPR